MHREVALDIEKPKPSPLALAISCVKHGGSKTNISTRIYMSEELTLIQVWRSRTAPAYTALLRDTVQIRWKGKAAD